MLVQSYRFELNESTTGDAILAFCLHMTCADKLFDALFLMSKFVCVESRDTEVWKYSLCNRLSPLVAAISAILRAN